MELRLCSIDGARRVERLSPNLSRPLPGWKNWKKRRIVHLILFMLCIGQSVPLQARTLREVVESADRGKAFSGPLRLVITTDKHIFSPGEAVKLDFHLKNVSEQVLTVKEIETSWDYVLELKKESGAPAPLTQLGRKLQLKRLGKSDDPNVRIKLDEPHVMYKQLGPGDERISDLDLKEFYDLSPGSAYVITAKRTVFCGKAIGTVDLTSNTVKVRIGR